MCFVVRNEAIEIHEIFFYFFFGEKKWLAYGFLRLKNWILILWSLKPSSLIGRDSR
jgi:hypothetical protein